MKNLNKQEVYTLFEANVKKHYKKRGRYLYRKAKEQEAVLTIVNGKLETLKRTSEGDVVLRNIEIGSSAETYIISQQKFSDRYECVMEEYLLDGLTWLVAAAKGEIEAFCYTGETVQFMAPWDELMLCNPGDYIARPVGKDKHDIYRIEKDTFALTYNEILPG